MHDAVNTDVDVGTRFFAGSGVIPHRASAFTDLGTFISILLPNAYLIAGVILFFYAVFGGLTILSSSGNPDKTKKGSQALTNAIIGFALIFTSYWIIQGLEIITGINII